jgi:uncharacterized membrane protein
MNDKTKNTLSWVLAGLIALALGFSGLSKLAGVQEAVVDFETWGYPSWSRYLVGVAEVAIAIALLMPENRVRGVFGVFAFTIGAVGTHLVAGQNTAIAPAIILGLLALIVLLLRKKE